MTTARRKRKLQRDGYPGRPKLATALGLAVALIAGLVAPVAIAGDQIVVDWHTGLAISGYDPVAFFTDGKPTAGSPDVELRYGGAIWRFSNVGNRAAFAASPDIYMPQYGGYDPVGVARGVAVAGNPYLWLIVGQRLFLFYDGERRDKFAGDPARVIGPADRKWPDVQHSLTP